MTNARVASGKGPKGPCNINTNFCGCTIPKGLGEGNHIHGPCGSSAECVGCSEHPKGWKYDPEQGDNDE